MCLVSVHRERGLTAFFFLCYYKKNGVGFCFRDLCVFGFRNGVGFGFIN